MFSVDNMSRTPVYEQIVSQVEKYIAVGLLKGGDQLPSVRNLSVELSVNPNTIQKAFSELDSRGLIVSVPGKGSFISQYAMDVINEKNRSKTADFIQLAKILHMSGLSEKELTDLVKTAIDGAEDGTAEINGAEGGQRPAGKTEGTMRGTEDSDETKKEGNK